MRQFRALLLCLFNIYVLFRSDNDPWDWLAKLMNILEALDDKSIKFESEMKEGKNIHFYASSEANRKMDENWTE